MIIAARYSFNGGAEAVAAKYPDLLPEIEEALASVDASLYRDKESAERTMLGEMLYSPVRLNAAIKARLAPKGWKPKRVQCDYPTQHYSDAYRALIADPPPPPRFGKRGQRLKDKPVKQRRVVGYREMDFIKEDRKLGVEVQFGKYSFMVYNVAAKMTIFRNLGHIDVGVEIVPLKRFSQQMSSGVSYFEQFVWDLEQRGVSNIDIPVLILGVDTDSTGSGRRPRVPIPVLVTQAVEEDGTVSHVVSRPVGELEAITETANPDRMPIAEPEVPESDQNGDKG